MNELQGGKFNTAGTAAVLCALIGWSVGPIFIKLISEHLDFWTQNAVRYSIAVLSLVPFMVYNIAAGRFNHRIWMAAIVPAGANIIMQCFWAKSFYLVDPAFMSLLVKSSVIWVSVFSFIAFRAERGLLFSYRYWVGLGLSVAGVVGVMASHEDFGTKTALAGVICTSCAAFFWAVYTVSVKVFCKGVTALDSFGVIGFYTAGGLCLLALKYGNYSEIKDLDDKVWGWIVISSVVSIAFSHVLYYASIKRIGATIPALVLLASPFTVLTLSYFFFGERLTAVQLIFGMVLLTGAGVCIWAQEHLRPKIT